MRSRIVVITVLLAGCANPDAGAPPGIVFPTHPGGAGAYPAALFDGTLEVVDGCVYLIDHGERWLGLWPAHLHVERRHGRITILDETDTVVGAEGQRIVVGGGESRPIEVGGSTASRSWAEELTNEDIADRCGDLYWLVSGVESD